MGKMCPVCGIEIREGEEICPNCGTSLEKGAMQARQVFEVVVL